MAKFDYLMEHKGAFFSFIFFLIPGTPKDYFCYILGLSPMHLVTFMIISTIGRLPGTLLLTMQGQAVQSEDYRTFFVVLGLALLAGVVAFIYRDRVETWFQHKKPGHGKEQPSPPRHRTKSLRPAEFPYLASPRFGSAAGSRHRRSNDSRPHNSGAGAPPGHPGLRGLLRPGLPRMNRQSDRRSAADTKRNSPVHEDQVRFDRGSHLHRPWGDKHLVVSMEGHAVEEMRQADGSSASNSWKNRL